MILENVLTRLHQKLASDEIGLAIQKCDAEAGELAICCLKAKRAELDSNAPGTQDLIGSAKENILNFVNSAKDKINSTPGGKNLAAGAGGAVLGGLLGNLSSSKNDFETDDDYKKRKRDSTMSGLLAGAAVGASIPSFASSFNLASNAVKPDETLKSSIKDMIVNPTSITAAGGGAAGYTLENLKAIAAKNLLPKDPTALEHSIAVGDHTYFGKQIEDLLTKRTSRLGTSFPRKGILPKVVNPILQKILKRKFLIPAAGAAIAPAAANLFFGDKVFDKPVFEQ